MNCAYHPDQPAVAVCSVCARNICQQDITPRGDRIVCQSCANQPAVAASAPPSLAPNGQPIYYLPYPYPPQPPTNGLAIASLVTGILSIVLGSCYGSGILFAIAALITGIIGNKQIKEHKPMSGSGFALTGIITGAVGAAIAILWIIFMIWFMPQLLSLYKTSYPGFNY